MGALVRDAKDQACVLGVNIVAAAVENNDAALRGRVVWLLRKVTLVGA